MVFQGTDEEICSLRYLSQSMYNKRNIELKNMMSATENKLHTKEKGYMKKKSRVVNIKNLIRLMIICLGIIGIKNMFGTIIADVIEKQWGQRANEILNNIYSGVEWAVILIVFVLFTFAIIYFFRKSLSHVSKYQRLECFNQIEFMMRNLGECDEYYGSIIREIFRIYETNEQLSQIIKDEKWESLYERKAYLENQLDVSNNIMEVITAAGVSGIITVWNNDLTGPQGVKWVTGLLVVVGLLACIFLKYFEKGRNGSYLYNVYKYELDLLNEKISALNRNLQTTEAEERIILLRQAIIHLLCDLYKSKKRRKIVRLRKKNIIDFSKELYKMPLLQGIEDEDIIWAKIKIMQRSLFFPVKIENGEYKCLNAYYERVFWSIQGALFLNK